MKRIAVVDDELDVRELIKIHLEREGYDALLFESGDDFLAFVETTPVDLVILDLMLPGTGGLEVCRIMRSNERMKTTPIIMATARGAETDIVVGLELGADDYVTKPFSMREFMARIKSVLRRVSHGVSERVLRCDMVEIYPDEFRILVKGENITLTTTEFKILHALISAKGRVLTRSQILEILGEDRQFVVDRTVDVHVLNIRKKLGDQDKIIKTVRGVGYCALCSNNR